MHVLIAGDTPEQVARATNEIEKILFADDQTRAIIRNEQLRIVAKIKNNEYNIPTGDFEGLKINYNNLDIPNPNAYIMAVPNECIGVILGKGGETIKNIQKKAEALNVQISADTNPNSQTRNIYVEGSEDAFKRVKVLIDEIVNTHLKMKSAFTDSEAGNGLGANVTLSIPVSTLSTVVGKNGESLM